MTSASRYRSYVLADRVVAFSISYQGDNMLARGMGLEHLRELLIRLARPLLRQGANLAYGGNWKETEDNFIFPLLRLVSAEQEDGGRGGIDTNRQIGRLYNHSPWPEYLKVTPNIEAQWINSCRVVRITQQMAGFSEQEVVPDADAGQIDPRTLFNKAITLSAMRRLMMQPMSIDIPDVPRPEQIPAVSARILLGGRLDGYSGFLPGIFEEALATLQCQCPVYLLGGFGGAAEILARAMLATGNDRPKELTLDWHKQRIPALAALLESTCQFKVPPLLAGMENSLDTLYDFVVKARADLPGTLNTGLSDAQTRELLQSCDIGNVVHLVRTGLINSNNLPALPA